ncbi:hypothetical protein J4G02_22085 [Candidatus Poribacteria bacterium]|nr:hypothetical protein [Candidatus Poribacteria bacterium]
MQIFEVKQRYAPCSVCNLRLADLREIIGWTPIPTLQRIKDTDAAEQLFEEIRNRT